MQCSAYLFSTPDVVCSLSGHACLVSTFIRSQQHKEKGKIIVSLAEMMKKHSDRSKKT